MGTFLWHTRSPILFNGAGVRLGSLGQCLFEMLRPEACWASCRCPRKTGQSLGHRLNVHLICGCFRNLAKNCKSSGLRQFGLRVLSPHLGFHCIRDVDWRARLEGVGSLVEKAFPQLFCGSLLAALLSLSIVLRVWPRRRLRCGFHRVSRCPSNQRRYICLVSCPVISR